MDAAAAVTTVGPGAIARPVAAAARWFGAPRTASSAGALVVLVSGVAVVHVLFPFRSSRWYIFPCLSARGIG